MSALSIELHKEKRTGVVPVLLAVGAVGAVYALANFLVRRESLLGMPLNPMDILLTQLYGMIVVLNMFGIIVATCMAYGMEFKGGAIKKMLVLPMSIAKMYASKLGILAFCLLLAILIQNSALAAIGAANLPEGTFDPMQVAAFGGYSFVSSLPVLSFMLLVSSRTENIWVSLGIGVAGFLSAMALANADSVFLLAHPFILMLKPAIAMSTQPDTAVLTVSFIETMVFSVAGLWLSRAVRYE